MFANVFLILCADYFIKSLREGWIADNATDYPINNTARSVLWLPISAEMKYKGKPTLDSLFVRIGDRIAAFTVFLLGSSS